ncbi:hypothetical protein CHELA40_13660 [Chelatococcus asaccharovorans]|nr:hypothetical protein CHELA40_13660 [Chelatococcus asaccharovorans]CAH1676510.1 hypothetical protein CHELA17_61965 [Chelatococcus asaccharovorans]
MLVPRTRLAPAGERHRPVHRWNTDKDTIVVNELRQADPAKDHPIFAQSGRHYSGGIQQAMLGSTRPPPEGRLQLHDPLPPGPIHVAGAASLA